ncbi:DNA adenine methylase [Candidatus Mycoplasma mahonii]|uniref:DNA adenine methylase n=1 Tax=Candidatus Mycoplasma mahonii TaxID=3004105 RepID=UPI0026EADA5B|nr:DNA adenine methylase [Candidatus Mycoplasma mahonii]WKX02272.1 DNA adenine methylase [Candidatus Mycoplasma mahonii]
MIRSPLFYSGDKYKILDQILPYIDENKRFIDPFVGGGSIVANINNKQIWVNDTNKHIIYLLKYFKNTDLHLIIKNIVKVSKKYNLSLSAYNKYEKKGDKNFFSKINKEGQLRLRSDFNKTKSTKLLFPLILYSYNRLIRFNGSGDYNVPVGTLDINKNVIKHIEEYTSEIKQKDIRFTNLDFKNIIMKAGERDVVFIDPPYLISNAEYNSNWFEKNEIELYKYIDEAIERGADILVTNYKKRGAMKNEIFSKFLKNKTKIKLRSFHYSFHNNSGNDAIEYLVIGDKNVKK